MKRLHKIAALLLVCALLCPCLGAFSLFVDAAEGTTEVTNYLSYHSGTVVIDQEEVDKYFATYPGQSKAAFLINNGVFSVTVSGDVDVVVIFNNVTIDNSSMTDMDIPADAGEAAVRLGWCTPTLQTSTRTETVEAVYENVTMTYRPAYSYRDTTKTFTTVTATYQYTYSETIATYAVIPTCPFLVTNGASVTLQFRGNNTLKAGGLAKNCKIPVGTPTQTDAKVSSFVGTDSNGSTTRVTTSTGGTALSVFESKYPPENRTATASSPSLESRGMGHAAIQVDVGATLTIESGGGTVDAYGAYQLEAGIPTDRNDSGGQYTDSYPSGVTVAGAPGIGGGATYNTTSFGGTTLGNGKTLGASGTLYINGGTINAYGGHQAAGIGGAANSPATTTSINIAGGNITARGGRWAAAIGDGDTSNDEVNSAFYTTDATGADGFYSINITGGNVAAYGGVGAAGIGTTDKITHADGGGADAYSRMQISLTGGHVKVRSGYPDDTNIDGKETSLAAAIGAGENTDMLPNTITVTSGCTLDAASFSAWAINNYGTTANADSVPIVNLDSDARLLLLSFVEYQSSTDRDFKLYSVLKDASGNSVYAVKNNSGVITMYLCPYDVYVDGNLQSSGYHECDATGAPLVGGRYYCVPTYDGEGELVSLSTEDGNNTVNVQDMDYAYDDSHPLFIYSVPDYFKAIAVTMPFDEDEPTFHGEYVLDIPTNGGENIEVGLNAVDQGIISGAVSEDMRHNLDVHSVTTSILNIVVSANGESYIGSEEFLPKVYAYSVYLPHATTNATITFTFDAYSSADGGNFTISVDGEEIPLANGATSYSVTVSNLLAGVPKEIRIKKQDRGTGGFSSPITYKILLCVKENYTITLGNLTDLVYNGNEVSPIVTAITKDNGNSVAVSAETLELTKFTYTYPDDTQSEVAPVNAGNYMVSAEIVTDTWQASTAAPVPFTVAKREITVIGITNYILYVNGEGLPNLSELPAQPAINDPGDILIAGALANDTVQLSFTAAYVNKTIGYHPEKIRITNIALDAVSAENYTVVTLPDGSVLVGGQIAYSTTGAIFKGPGDEEAWEKFFPVDSENALDFSQAEVQNDYHHKDKDGNTSSSAHTEQVWFRTVNSGVDTAMYAVDIEFGQLAFIFTLEIWNSDELRYDEVEGESRWIGMDDGVNNRIRITNLSNRTVSYLVSCKIDVMQQPIDESANGIRAAIRLENSNSGALFADAISIPAATPPALGEENGTATAVDCWLRLSGIPLLEESTEYSVVGVITVSVEML